MSPHFRDELVEHEPRFLGPRVALGVSLEGEGTSPSVPQPLEGPVVGVRGPRHEAGVVERVRVDGVPMVLADDQRATVREADRLVLPPVSVLELERRSPWARASSW